MKPRVTKTNVFGSKKQKPTESAEKRKQHAKSLIGYRPDGGDAS
jgi:hypothetical protein